MSSQNLKNNEKTLPKIFKVPKEKIFGDGSFFLWSEKKIKKERTFECFSTI